MNKKFKKICSIILGLAIAASSAISMSASAEIYNLSDYTIIDDKGMEKYDGDVEEGYKVLYKNGIFYRAEPLSQCAQFILSKDVDYEEANERVMEIFNEFYSGEYLAISLASSDYYLQPVLESETVNGVTTYTLQACIITSLHDEKLEAAAAKHCKDFMKKLNEEKLISAFYDFGEVYWIREEDGGYSVSYHDPFLEAQGKSIDMIYNYLDEHDTGCTIEKKAYTDESTYYYKLKSNDGDVLKAFLTAVDIYEATSIVILPLYTLESGGSYLYGKNAIEELWSPGDANGDNEITIQDCLYIAKKLAHREGVKLPDSADYNKDGKKNIKDAAALAMDIAKRNIG